MSVVRPGAGGVHHHPGAQVTAGAREHVGDGGPDHAVAVEEEPLGPVWLDARAPYHRGADERQVSRSGLGIVQSW
jgi:hypothetical protein